jgi:putative ABC transport system permease protein
VSLRRLQTALISGFALLALVLALVGTGGLLFHAVAERQHEIGVRLAIGAQTREILAMVLREGAMLVGAGVASGLALALALHRVINSFLYGVQSTDSGTYIVACSTVIVVSFIAVYVPARRAARVDPIVVLRSE